MLHKFIVILGYIVSYTAGVCNLVSHTYTKYHFAEIFPQFQNCNFIQLAAHKRFADARTKQIIALNQLYLQNIFLIGTDLIMILTSCKSNLL